jgi:phosphoribosylformylglycinamidine synthase
MTSPAVQTAVHRIEVSPAPGMTDPIGESVRREAAAAGIELSAARATHVYLIEAPFTESQLNAIRNRLLTDPVTEVSQIGTSAAAHGSQVIEIHPLPGVMDPVAQTVQESIRELLSMESAPAVTTGWRYDLTPSPDVHLPASKAAEFAARVLANPVIQRVLPESYHPRTFPRSSSHDNVVRSVGLITLNDEQLTKLSREAHLFLSLDEMRALQEHYRSIGRDPREIELETLAQTWSEHCVHKTLKSTIRFKSSAEHDPIDWSNRPGHEKHSDGSIRINNLLKSTVAAATHKLIADGVDWTLSIFVDNSGVIAFDDHHAVCVKVETHNHPSAIEPYGGAATGVGGCIRDVIGTGLGARPIANTDVFCVAPPDTTSIPEGCLPPRRILSQVVAGVRDYGNRMGIPTVSGGVHFDERYVGNPLVYCGCIGVMPRTRTRGKVNHGDLIVALGGRTGRDGIHGATFSSAELEHSAADEFSHAVQIGNAITEKQVLDAIMRAAGEGFGAGGPLFSALTDCGAGGFSSAIGELGKDTGATVHLDRAAIKYAGLSFTEIWISEAQERMVLAVPPENLEQLRHICSDEHVELAVLGEFAPPEGSTAENPDLRLMFHGSEVGRLSMHFLHEGIPTPTRDATWATPKPSAPAPTHTSAAESLEKSLLALLSHPTVASKHWIVRQYDHEVRGATVLKPLVGPQQRGPGNGSVLLPVEGSTRGLAVSQGLQTGVGDPLFGGDPYLMALASIDECVRNLVCVGADPEHIAILDNFCWPSCSKPENLGSLVRAAEGCYDGAVGYRTPFVSGKDSLNNQFTTRDGRTIEIPPTLLITGIGIVPDVRKCLSSDAKQPGNAILLVGATGAAMGGSLYQRVVGIDVSQLAAAAHGQAPNRGLPPDLAVPKVHLRLGPTTARMIHRLNEMGLIRSAHDCSEGGMLVALAEMLIGGSTSQRPIGAAVDLSAVPGEAETLPGRTVAAFSETPSRYLLEVCHDDLPAVKAALAAAGIPRAVVAVLDDSGKLDLSERLLDPVPVEKLVHAWTSPLDW